MISRIFPLLTSAARNNAVRHTVCFSRYNLQKPTSSTSFEQLSRAYCVDMNENRHEDPKSNEHVNRVTLTGTIQNVKRKPDSEDLQVILRIKRPGFDRSDFISVVIMQRLRTQFFKVGELLTVEGATYKYKLEDGTEMQDVFARRIIDTTVE